MKKVLKWTLAVLMTASLGSLVSSCSSDENNNEMENKSMKVVKEDNLEKNWIVAHFDFNESCKGAKKLAYQVSSVHISLSGNAFNAVDQYSLKEDKGSWVLDNNVIVVSSEAFGPKLQFKIRELKHNSLIVDVIDHEDLSAIELVSFDK